VRTEISNKDTFKCDAFRPNLSVVNVTRSEQSETENVVESSGNLSQKEKWFKAYAVQQLRIDPDQIHFKIRYHIAISTIQRSKLFSHQNFEKIDKIFHQLEFPFEDTKIYLLCSAPDHIHLYIDSSPDYSIEEIVNAVMESSEREIVIQLPELQKFSNALWERAYFLEGIG
jgi:REP element-mobilizing transposase RayT